MFTSRMKKIRELKGFVIATNKDNQWAVYTKDEWSMGEGLRYEEIECGSLQECIDFIG